MDSLDMDNSIWNSGLDGRDSYFWLEGALLSASGDEIS